MGSRGILGREERIICDGIGIGNRVCAGNEPSRLLSGFSDAMDTATGLG